MNQRSLYPPIQCQEEFRLQVSELHEIRVEVSGNPKGKPVIFLHGGPGGGCSPEHRRFFNPEKYRIILFDQRGAGKSTPLAETRENTTWDLVADIEKMRESLEIDRWQVFGGSWGSTLALSYAIQHPNRVSELVLRGIFLIRQKEIDWFYQSGASRIFPEAWTSYRNHIPEEERGSLLKAYHQRLNHSDIQVQRAAAREWSMWELRCSQLIPNEEKISETATEDFLISFARIETHYFINRGFFETEDYFFKNIEKIRKIPAVIVHGRYDIVCPVENAFELHQLWPESELVIVPDAGHSAMESGIISELVKATDRFADSSR